MRPPQLEPAARRVFTMLLRLLPPWLRALYREELDAVFAQRLADARAAGALAAIAFLRREAGSLLAVAVRTRFSSSDGPGEWEPFQQPLDDRPLRVAWLVALVLHFVAFTIVMPFGGQRIDAQPERQPLVLEIWNPPKRLELPTKPARVVRRSVPVPLVEPDDFTPEPVVAPEEPSFIVVSEDGPTMDFTLSGPIGVPEPPQQNLYTSGVEVTPPRLLHKVEPRYSELALRARIECEVQIEAHIGTDGAVAELSVRKSCGFGLDREALRAVRQWRFAPTRINGRPVEVLAVVTAKFVLH